MSIPFIAESTIDDLLRSVAVAIKNRGMRVAPSKGPATELLGYLLELRNPRARLSRTETRGKAFSCLGELCWYLSKGDDHAFIEHYIGGYPGADASGRVYGAYGPRLFDFRGEDQISNVIDRLRHARSSRRAVVQIFDAADLPSEEDEIPCTCTLQFLVREAALHLLVCMRSNDAVLGLPHDIFCFTMLQEIIARAVGVRLGIYRHFVGSLHIYDRHSDMVDAFLDEGWQSTEQPMPRMPDGEPWEGVEALLAIEALIRSGSSVDEGMLASMDSYWADLARLLEVHAAARRGDHGAIRDLRDQMASDVYNTFVEGRLAEQ